MFGIDWANLQIYHYLAMGGGALALLALILYFVAPTGIKMPAGVTGTVLGVVAGIGLGVIGMAAFGYEPPTWVGTLEAGDEPPPPAMKGTSMPGTGTPGKGTPGKGTPGKSGGKAKGPNSKVQLAALVIKLDQLTGKPLAVTLTPDQRKVLRAQLEGLADAEELKDADAKKRLEAILQAVEPDRATLEAAGYRWPGSTGSQAPPASPNPFKEGEGRERLDSLQGHVAGKQ